jgi:hypothetical protein
MLHELVIAERVLHPVLDQPLEELYPVGAVVPDDVQRRRERLLVVQVVDELMQSLVV